MLLLEGKNPAPDLTRVQRSWSLKGFLVARQPRQTRRCGFKQCPLEWWGYHFNHPRNPHDRTFQLLLLHNKLLQNLVAYNNKYLSYQFLWVRNQNTTCTFSSMSFIRLKLKYQPGQPSQASAGAEGSYSKLNDMVLAVLWNLLGLSTGLHRDLEAGFSQCEWFKGGRES